MSSTHAPASTIGSRADWASSVESARTFRAASETDQKSFEHLLGRATQDAAGMTPEKKARTTAEQFVAVALVQPLLKQLRESTKMAAPFGPSQGEKQFQSLIDADIAQKVVSSAHFPLVDRIAKTLGERAAKTAAPQPGSVEEISHDQNV